MAASLTALGAIVVSDIAEARDSREVFDDELPAASPVKVSKVSVKAEEPALDEIFEPVMPKPRKGKRATIDYGAFEGY